MGKGRDITFEDAAREEFRRLGLVVFQQKPVNRCSLLIPCETFVTGSASDPDPQCKYVLPRRKDSP
jgi:hypothetical protein